MTEKRFTLDFDDPRAVWIDDNLTDKSYDVINDTVKEKNIQEIVDLLNAFYNENEQLKSERKIWLESQEELECLSDENKWLKIDKQNYYRQDSKIRIELRELKQQIRKLEAQLYCTADGVCDICGNKYLVQQGRYFVSKCNKGHDECSKTDLDYCDDFELKEDDSND